MRNPTFRVRSAGLLLGLAGPMLLAHAAPGADDDRPPSHPWLGSEVVMKDLFVQPRLGVHVVNPSVRDHRFRVGHTRGPWLWVTSHETHGWVHQNEVVPLASAVDFFTAVILSHPYSAHAYYMRGLVWLDRDEPDIAIADFTDAIERDGNNAWAFHNRARAHAAKGDYKRAIADYTETIRLNPLDAAAYNNRGSAHDRSGAFDKAIADYGEAIRHDPALINAFYNRAGAFAEKHEDRLAVRDYDRVIQLSPEDADAHARLAWILATSADPGVRDPGNAVEAGAVANKLSGETNPVHLEALAAAYASAGDWEKAIATQSKALERIAKDDAERARAEVRLNGYRGKQPARE
jgi:tetratricopeptide (TPR) repeat protein